jgi:hypothetical protein
MNNFIKDRNNILKNLDNPECMIQVARYCKKYDIAMPQSTETILAGLHKARLYVMSKDITNEMKESSRQWLKEHNYSEDIFKSKGE